MMRGWVIRLAAASIALLVAAALGGCVQATPAPVGLIELLAQPAEKALFSGLRAYDDAQYVDSERSLVQAINLRLASPKDRAAAHKHLAFIYCTSNRRADCETQFRSARLADPSFTLSKSEAGHPSWSEVYKRVLP